MEESKKWQIDFMYTFCTYHKLIFTRFRQADTPFYTPFLLVFLHLWLSASQKIKRQALNKNQMQGWPHVFALLILKVFKVIRVLGGKLAALYSAAISSIHVNVTVSKTCFISLRPLKSRCKFLFWYKIGGQMWVGTNVQERLMTCLCELKMWTCAEKEEKLYSMLSELA